jgi:hypothetical protein
VRLRDWAIIQAAVKIPVKGEWMAKTSGKLLLNWIEASRGSYINAIKAHQVLGPNHEVTVVVE